MAWDALSKDKKEAEVKTIKPEDVFTPIAKTYGRRGLKIGVWGVFEAGKTYFALSAPPPVFVISTEQGVTQVAHHFPDKDIRIVETLSLKTDLEGKLIADPIESLENVESAISACKDIDKGTIVIDTLSDIWDWVQAWMEVTAAPKDKRDSGGVFQFAYGRANERYKYLLLKLISRPTHFIGTARTRPVYVAQQDSGSKEARWQKDTPFLLDIIIKMDKVVQSATNVLYLSTIEKNRYFRMFNATKEDMTFDKLLDVLKGKLPPEVLA